ncbi:MAG: trans-sialidase, partial [Thaumarchaeota archaeon]|nr:trans-sialidase [Nitrososphaerota archaeon]
RALAAQVEVTPSNWNDHKTKITGYTAPGNKYFATKQRLAYHPEAKKFGTWINDAPASGQAKSAPPPPPPPQPEIQASAGSASDGKSKQQELEDYEKEYLVRLEQKKVDDAKAAAEAAAAEAAATAAAQSNRGSMPKGWGPAGAKANTGH